MAYVGYTSYSHTPDKPRYRVFVPYSKPIEPGKQKAAFAYFEALFGDGELDERSKTTTQLWYLPGCPPDALEYYECWSNDAPIMNPDTIPALTEESAPKADDEPQPAGDAEFNKLRSACLYIAGTGRPSDKMWVDVGMGIKRAFPNEQGWGLFHLFSSINKEGDDEGAWRKRWDSFDQNKANGIGVGTVFKYARDVGWQPPAADPGVEEDEHDDEDAPANNGERLDDPLLDSAPGLIREYIEYYKQHAVVGDPVYGFASALMFLTAAVGNLARLDDGNGLNSYWMVTGGTGSGKQGVYDFANRFLSDVNANERTILGVPGFDRGFASGPAVWWRLQAGACVYFNPEIETDLLSAARKHGSNAEEVVKLWLPLYDAVKDPQLMPIQYSKRTKGTEEMKPLSYAFFSIFGTATRDVYGSTTGGAASSGLLNRFTILNSDGGYKIRAVGKLETPQFIHEWARWFSNERILKGVADPTPPDAPANFTPVRRLVLRIAPEVAVALNKANQDAKLERLAQKHPGTWHRVTFRALKLAGLAALARRSLTVELADYAWAEKLTRQAAEQATRAFAAEGGLSGSESSKLEKSVRQAFASPTAKRRGGVMRISDLKNASRLFDDAKHQDRQYALRALLEDGSIIKVPAAKGEKYRPSRRLQRQLGVTYADVPQ